MLQTVRLLFFVIDSLVYQIKDLEANAERFASDVRAWKYPELYWNSYPYDVYGGQYFLGGYEVRYNASGHYFERIYTQLPSHNRIFFSAQLVIQDSWNWNDNEWIEIKLDSFIFKLPQINNYYENSICYRCPTFMRISGTINHTGSSLQLTITSQSKYCRYEIGIRDLSFNFAKNSTLKSNMMCRNMRYDLSSQKCFCQDGQYQQGLSCYSCHRSCAICFGPSASECYKCNEGYSFDGTECIACSLGCATCNGTNTSQCTSCTWGYALFENGKCITFSSCSYPLILSYDGAVCEYPCQNKTYFLYWTGDCYPSCDLPLQADLLLNTVKYCRNPCPLDYCYSYARSLYYPYYYYCESWRDYYLYWDGGCRTSCYSPFRATYKYGRYFCDFPCTDPNDFLYWNGSCLPTCGNFLTSTTTYGGQFKLCQFPCGNQYLYWNGSCGNTCRYPLKVKIEGGKYYCTRPCNSGEYLYLNNTCSPNPCENRFQLVNLTGSVLLCVSICDGGPPYLYYDNTCRGNCLPPLTPGNEYGILTCDYICTRNQYLYWNGSCLEKCNFPLVNRTEGGAQFCDYPCTSLWDYLYWNGSCKSICDTPFKIRIESSLPYCDMPCNVDEYFYWNGSCSPSCMTPLAHQSQNSINYCIYPCLLEEYLYWNTSCKPTCLYPFQWKIENFRQFCNLKCHPDDFLYWSESCNSSCNFPLTHRVLDNVKLCEYPCLTSQYLYWNGTCANSCPSYYNLSVFEARNLCNPLCPIDQFFYIERKTCVKKCPLQFFGSNITKLCQKCTNSLCNVCPDENRCESCIEGAILDINDTCRACNESRITYLRSITKGHQYRLQLLPTSCDLDGSTVEMNLEGLTSSIPNFPAFAFKVIKRKSNFYQVDLILESDVFEEQNLNVTLFYLNATMKVPKKFLPNPLMEEIAQHTGTAQTTVNSFMGVSLGGTLAIGAAAAMWSLLSFQQFVGFFTYLNVEYPPQVKVFLSMFQSVSWEILPNPLADLTSRWSKDILESEDPVFDKYDPPKKFLDEKIKSYFIENGGSIIALNIGLLLILGFVKLLRRIKSWKEKRILKIIEKKLQWNVIIRMFLGDGIQLSFSIFLQLRCISFENVYLALCTVLSMFSLLYLIVMTIFSVNVMKKHQKKHLRLQGVQELYGTLYEGMDTTKAASRYYHIIILSRGIMLMLVTTLFGNYPLLQTSILIYMNAGLIYFLFKKAGFLNRKLDIINKIKEVLTLLAEICVLFLQFQIDSIEYYDACGWIMICSVVLSLLVEILYISIIQLLQIKKLIINLWRWLQFVTDYLKRCINKRLIKKKSPKNKDKDSLNMPKTRKSKILNKNRKGKENDS